MKSKQAEKIIFYGTEWCGDCFRSRKLLTEAGIDFIEIDVDEDPKAAEKVIEINNGYRSVPTIIFPDGTILVEPSNLELAKLLENYPDTGQ